MARGERGLCFAICIVVPTPKTGYTVEGASADHGGPHHCAGSEAAGEIEALGDVGAGGGQRAGFRRDACGDPGRDFAEPGPCLTCSFGASSVVVRRVRTGSAA